MQYVGLRRNTKEFEIATYGPNIANCNSVVKEAMDLFWSSRRGAWHIFRSSVIEKLKSSRGQNHVHRKQHPLHELNASTVHSEYKFSPIQLGYMSYIRHSGIKDLNV